MTPRRAPWRERWEPHELGHSLPVTRGLRRWAAGLAAAALVGLGVLVVSIRALGSPEAEPATGKAVEEAAVERLARAELPAWDPGAELPAVAAPDFAPPPAPPVVRTAHPGDPPLRDRGAVLGALEDLAGPAPVAAATTLGRAAEAQPASWMLAYDAGIAFHRSGFADRAAADLLRAQRRLGEYEVRFARDPAHHAAAVATRYAAGHARLRDDCVDAVHHWKLGVGALDRFVDAGGAHVFDRKLPFVLAPAPLASLDVWMALARGYVECEGRYPAEYFARVPRAKRFVESEYGDPEAAEIADGPFPDELAQCVRDEGATARCWVLSNLNKLWAANDDLVLADALPEPFEPHRAALARLAYDVALLAATGPDRAGAAAYLQAAGRLARGAPETAGLGEAIARLGRYLAAEAGDFTLLAEAYRGLGPGEMPFTATSTAEEVKGMAWALRERWRRHLAAGRPEAVFAEVERVRQVIPDVHLDSLEAWSGAAREALRDALADEIRLQKRRGNLALAAGLRDFRAGYLGEAWADRAEAAWWTPGLRAARWGLVFLYALFLAGLVLLYRSVVYPYLVYTTDFYRTEMERRVRERRARDLPVTGEEIYRWQRERLGGPESA